MNVLGPDSSIGKPHIVILGCISEVGWGPTEGAENTRLSFTGQLEGLLDSPVRGMSPLTRVHETTFISPLTSSMEEELCQYRHTREGTGLIGWLSNLATLPTRHRSSASQGQHLLLCHNPLPSSHTDHMPSSIQLHRPQTTAEI